MVRVSANLGFLWTDRPLVDAIGAAANAGFDAVECHFPYDVDAADVRTALADGDLAMVALNTERGDAVGGEVGLAAVPGREREAQALIQQAIDYATAIGCTNVHVMAGRAEGGAARSTFVDNLTFAAAAGAANGVGILIEPINQRDMPGYFLSEVEVAAEIVAEARRASSTDNVSIMFDCYHVQITQGDLLRRFETHRHLVGHVQFASVPDRSEPDRGEVDYRWLLPQLYASGYDGYVGAEYRPATTSDAGLGWLSGLV